MKKIREFIYSFFPKKDSRVKGVIRLREEFGTPEENSKELIALTAKDFEKIRNRKDPQNLFFGRFMSNILMIELKLVQLLIKYNQDVEELTLGRKVDLFKSFLKDYSELDNDVSSYRELIAPLKELVIIRNNMAHDLSYIYFHKTEISQTIGFMKKVRRDLFNHQNFFKDENDQNMVVVITFGFYFSTQIAHLDMRVV